MPAFTRHCRLRQDALRRLIQRPLQPRSYASKTPRPTNSTQQRPPPPNPSSRTAKPASHEPPSIPPRRPAPLEHEPSRQAPRRPEGPEEVKRWHVRQQIGYKGVAWKISQLIVGIPIVIVFGYHLYGRLFLGWEQKQPVRITEDGKVVSEPIMRVSRSSQREP